MNGIGGKGSPKLVTGISSSRAMAFRPSIRRSGMVVRHRAALRAEGLHDVPDQFATPTDLDAHWRDPRLLLSHACGRPLVTSLQSDVQVIGVFHYDARGCVGIESLRGRTVAVNSLDSHSGCNALRGVVAPLSCNGAFFGAQWISGSHRRSLAAVLSGMADIAAIDAITLAGLRHHAPDSSSACAWWGMTASAPGRPLITSAATSPAELSAIRRALAAASLDSAAESVRSSLLIRRLEAADVRRWQPVADLAPPSAHTQPTNACKFTPRDSDNFQFCTATATALLATMRRCRSVWTAPARSRPAAHILARLFCPAKGSSLRGWRM